MNTKIEGLGPGLPRPSSGSSSSAAAPHAGIGRASAVADDSVKLSGEASGLASLERSLAESPGFDAAKVASVRAALQAGTYRIDPQQIAAKLTHFEQALGA